MAGRIANAAQAKLRAGGTLTPALEAYRSVVRWRNGEDAPHDFLDVALPRWNGRTALVSSALALPLRWRRPRRVFVDSEGDLFHESVTDGQIMAVFDVMFRTRHTYQVLTKRPARALDWVRRWHDTKEASNEPMGLRARSPADVRRIFQGGRAHLFAGMLDTLGEPPAGYTWPSYDWMEGPRWWPSVPMFDNVWLGFSAEDQGTFDERWSHAREWARLGWPTWVSLEPLLGPVDLRAALDAADAGPLLRWAVVGGESGPGARPMHSAWAAGIRDQCTAAGVSFFMKQAGSHLAREWACFDRKGGESAEWPAEFQMQEFPG